MRVRYLLLTCVLVSTIFWGKSALLTAAPLSGPHFADIIVTTSDTQLLLFGELRNSLTPDMIDGLHSGMPIHFSFFVQLVRSVPNWLDQDLVKIEFSHSLTYDTLKEVYIVETEESSRKKIIASTLQEATKLLNEINGLKIIELSKLVPETTYRLRVKADLYKKSLPLSLHNIIPFVSWWDLKTDWYTVEFIY